MLLQHEWSTAYKGECDQMPSNSNPPPGKFLPASPSMSFADYLYRLSYQPPKRMRLTIMVSILGGVDTLPPVQSAWLLLI